MENMEKVKSDYKKSLVEVIIKSIVEDCEYEALDNLEEILQKRLDSNLKFQTKVFDFKNENNHILGKISFNDDDDEIITNFTIVRTGIYNFEINKFK